MFKKTLFLLNLHTTFTLNEQIPYEIFISASLSSASPPLSSSSLPATFFASLPGGTSAVSELLKLSVLALLCTIPGNILGSVAGSCQYAAAEWPVLVGEISIVEARLVRAKAWSSRLGGVELLLLLSTRFNLVMSRLECEREGRGSLTEGWLGLLKWRRELPDDEVGSESCIMATIELCGVGRVGAT